MKNKKKYKIYVDNNVIYMDKNRRSLFGEYNTMKDAINVCENVVNKRILNLDYSNLNFDQLWNKYIAFNDDLWVLSPEGNIIFSAREYAKKEFKELAGKIDCQILTKTLAGVKTSKKIYELAEQDIKNYHKLGQASSVSLLACISIADNHVNNFIDVVYGYTKTRSEFVNLTTKVIYDNYLTIDFYEKCLK